MGLEPTTSGLEVRRAIHCATETSIKQQHILQILCAKTCFDIDHVAKIFTIYTCLMAIIFLFILKQIYRVENTFIHVVQG